MKMLFYSSDDLEVQHVSKEFRSAGIPCEIRDGPKLISKYVGAPQSELWIHNDKDCHRALMLCVQLGIGFSRRPPKPLGFDELDELEAAAAARRAKAESNSAEAQLQPKEGMVAE